MTEPARHTKNDLETEDPVTEAMERGHDAPPAEEAAGPAQVPPAEVPSWFAKTYPRLSGEDVAQRYRQAQEAMPSAPVVMPGPEAYEAYKRRLEERFRMAQRLADPSTGAAEPAAPRSKVVIGTQAGHVAPPPRPRLQRQNNEPGKSSKAQEATAPTGREFGVTPILTLGLLACVIGGAGGYGYANPEQAKGVVTASISTVGGWFSGFSSQKPAVAETVIAKKPVRITKLDVQDVSGPVNGPIPLSITAQPADDTPLNFKISGLPPEAYLTKGVQISEGEWLLKPADVSRAQLVIPRASVPEIGLEVAALEEGTGDPVAPVQEMRVALDLSAVPVPGLQPPPALPQPAAGAMTAAAIPAAKDTPAALQAGVQVQPVSALPDQGFNTTPDAPKTVPQPLERLNGEAQSLLAKGATLLQSGDVIAARQFYLKAFEMKAPEGALGVGKTYDPATYAALNVQGLQPDPRKAAEWYGKAAAQGVAEASEALSRLPGQAQP